VLFILVVAAAGFAQPEAAAPAGVTYVENALQKGETLEFTLSWLAIDGGSAVMKVGPLDGDPSKIRIESLAQSSPSFARIYKVRDYLESIVERDTFSTVRFRKDLREKKRHKDVTTTIDYEQGLAFRRDKKIPVTRQTLDPLSSIYYIRKLDLSPGKKHVVTILADEKVYRPEIQVVKRETINVPAGRFRTVLVEPKMTKGSIFRDDDSRLFIWYTDDERRIPVRIRSELAVGSITAALKAYRVSGEPSTAIPAGR
jgi:hypothetical protein